MLSFIFADMKRTTILILGFIMSLSFVALLSLQVKYIEEMVKMRQTQFDESVKRSLYNAAHKLELYETMRYLEQDAIASEKKAAKNQQNVGVVTHQYDIKSKDGIISSFEMRTIVMPRHPQNRRTIPEASRSLQDIIRSRYAHQRSLMDEVIYKISP